MIYGEQFLTGDTIGVLLNMEKGTLSYFYDGFKFVIVKKDLGVAFQSLEPNSVRSGWRNPLYPCFGFRKGNCELSVNCNAFVTFPGRFSLYKQGIIILIVQY